MEYAELTAAHQEALRRERILALESDHYRTLLLIGEVGPEEPLQQQLAELEERIALYRDSTPEPREPDIAFESEPDHNFDKAPG